MELVYADKYPLTDVQKAMLSYAKDNDGTGICVVQMRVTLREKIDLSTFKLAWSQIIARHEMLRAGVYGKKIGRRGKFGNKSFILAG